jgi:predicted GNAT family acetyltransferase
MQASNPDLDRERAVNAEIRENPTLHRFELALDGGAMALACNFIEDGRLILTHTEVPAEFSGRGIGTRLANGTFELMRRSGRKAVLKCPFMGHFLPPIRNMPMSSRDDAPARRRGRNARLDRFEER